MKPRPTFEKRRKEELRKARQQDKAERRATRKANKDTDPESPAETPDEPMATSAEAKLFGLQSGERSPTNAPKEAESVLVAEIGA